MTYGMGVPGSSWKWRGRRWKGGPCLMAVVYIECRGGRQGWGEGGTLHEKLNDPEVD